MTNAPEFSPAGPQSPPARPFVDSILSSRRRVFDQQAPDRETWKTRHAYYHRSVEEYCRMLIPPNSRVLELGCGTGDLLAAVKPSFGIGVDISTEAVNIASQKYPDLYFVAGYAEHLPLCGEIDFIVLSDVIGLLADVQQAFEQLHTVIHRNTRVVITYYNFLWEPIFQLAEYLGLKQANVKQNWLAPQDQKNLLTLADMEVVREFNKLLIPVPVPGLSWLCNRFLSQFPGFQRLCLSHILVARPNQTYLQQDKNYSCSIIIPAKNERDNIRKLVERIPPLGSRTEVIFVDGNSTDGTVEEMESVMEKPHENLNFTLIHQGSGVGKGDAVRKGFASAKGDILMILDSDNSVSPEDLVKFYKVLASGKGEFANGSRLVYPLETQAMRTLNILGNKFFGMMFTWLLGQPFRDTLCGTKAIFREDYERLAAAREYFGDFDPFGDFDLIFGAVRQNLKIVQVPVRYYARTYGTTKISRFQHGWLLLRMCHVAAQKLKFC